MKAAILAIGDELLGGRCQDTNSTWLSGRCALMGVQVLETRSVGDDLERIVAALQSLLAEADLVFMTGGLGPTRDDLTRESVASLLGQELVEDSGAMEWLEAFFSNRSLEMGASQRRLATRPSGGTCFRNHVGTAPTIHARATHGDLWLLPGPPAEMHDAWDRHVDAWLREALGGVVISKSVDIRSFGLIEATFEERLGESTRRDHRPLLGTRVSRDEFLLHIDPAGVSQDVMESCVKDCSARLHPWNYGTGTDTLQSVVGSLLRDRGEMLATAESCTGGWIGRDIVDVSGSSAWYAGGWIVYSNEMKASQLGVDKAVLEKHGAVSEPVVRSLAESAASLSGAQWGLSVSGIAGPDGGTPDKPVGMVWIGCHGPSGTFARCFNLGTDRMRIRRRAASMSLQILRWCLVGEDPMTPTSWDLP
ncbi:MAG: CinA family nicotinamide mononucleotide deamidase-related protein [Phycisphaerales bacterium]|nr:CinA family nicotinamide mononucleotide deamidase-related protein [Phycisphaerales bacterium]